MDDFPFALCLSTQDAEPPDAADDDDDDEGGGRPAAVQPERPVPWPPRVRLFLPPALPVPCPATRGS